MEEGHLHARKGRRDVLRHHHRRRFVRSVRRAGRDLRPGDGSRGHHRRRLLAVPGARAPPARGVDQPRDAPRRQGGRGGQVDRRGPPPDRVAPDRGRWFTHCTARTMMDDLNKLVDERVALETRLQNEKGELSEDLADRYEGEYADLQRKLAALFRRTSEERERITLMLELMRILENRLVYLHNFVVDANPDNRLLAQLVTRFIAEIAGTTVLTKLEATYYRGVAALYAGDAAAAARAAFTEACASEESDETNDIKYKSFVILGHLSHEERDYVKAKELHDQSLRYTQSGNVTAQALALGALNAYALADHDEALH